jgi:hypothetical protein
MEQDCQDSCTFDREASFSTSGIAIAPVSGSKDWANTLRYDDIVPGINRMRNCYVLFPLGIIQFPP